MLPRAIQRRQAALSETWRLLANEGDALWWPFEEPPRSGEHVEWGELPQLRLVADPRSLVENHEAVFWAHDAWAREKAAEWGFGWQGPAPEIVARVNSRRFQVAWEQRLGLALPGLALVTNCEELTAALAAFGEDPWILKTEFGTAGRESFWGTGPPTARLLAWAKKRFSCRLAIIVEPRLDRLAEASFQFQVHPTGDVEFLDVVGCLAKPGGTFLASRLLEDAEATGWRAVLPEAQAVAEAIAAEGYHGPLGIDAMRFRDSSGRERIRPIQDINARYTFGRLALRLTHFPELSRRWKGMTRPLKPGA